MLEAMAQQTPIDRPAARVLLLDEEKRVLLMKFSYRGRCWWCAPGGGLEEGETHEDAAKREIAEETGFELQRVNHWVWNREHVCQLKGRLVRQIERYFVASVPIFEPHPRDLEAEEASVLRGMRWWTLSELKNSTEEFAPAKLPELLRKIVEDGPPKQPITVGE